LSFRETTIKYVKDIIRQTEEDSPDTNIKTNIFNSVTRVKADYVKLEGIEEGFSQVA
jgi:hypothetical protein